MQRGHMENNLNNFYNKIQRFAGTSPLRGPCRHKACCNGNNYEQRFALDTFPADFSWRNVLAKPCILLFTLQQDCNTREACRLLLVVKVVFVVFPNSAGRIGNSKPYHSIFRKNQKRGLQMKSSHFSCQYYYHYVTCMGLEPMTPTLKVLCSTS